MEQFSRDGLVFDVSDSGIGDEVVVLLHGWPQDRQAWSKVTPLLTVEGLRVVAFDQRGYSPGAHPRGREAYRMPELVDDVRALLDELGQTRVHLVGHDWGGAVAWAFAERHPERLLSLTVVSTPHHRALAWALRHADQARRSWYMAAFQVPTVPELVLRRRLPAALRRSGLPEPDVQRYAARFRRPGMARGGLAWYRAIPLRRKTSEESRAAARISTPTAYVWGRHDVALGRAAAERTRDHVAADYTFTELDAGHWLPETRPEEVAAVILERRRTVRQ
ncbi:pimeloyl-ACP methyl ester carboxylesterase [Phycicoccus badiiscoriae]|uniref:Pimeloyl-ACP methyl ester carboxylesterase n=1 Tax=Pedococcus badiiscoriae TaxID=642776 RepID=A0A852WGB0_9MICO|nr:alpha/beta fold hydrolase [Pedococcus badiiscoriae]NYG06551.1 pimeloyl-ACP methyl ester carboxylesterase [Pedococcus badiiscoriae]